MHLAADGALRRKKQVLRHLLGDRRTALYHAVGAGVLHDGTQRAEHVNTEVIEEAGIFGCQHGLDQLRRNLVQWNGVVLADAALADDFAIHVGEGDGIFAAAVPPVAGAGEGRQRIGQQREERSRRR